MKKPEIPENEEKRLEVLKKYEILDTLPEDEYDEITTLASQICGTPISLISLIDGKRQWFKSRLGLGATETSKEVAFCAHAINDKDNLFIINDSRKDNRFHDNPLVTDDPNVIFYAGIPLVVDGYPLGTLCVIDNKPNELNEDQIKALRILSNQVIKLFELRSKKKELEDRVYAIELQNVGLQEFAQVAAHDIKSPLSNIVMLSEHFKNQYKDVIDEEGLHLLDHLNCSSQNLISLVNGILAYSKNANLLTKEKTHVNVIEMLYDIFNLMKKKYSIQFVIDSPLEEIFINKIALERIFINLIDNGIKYNTLEQVEICIKIRQEEKLLKINVIDNGIGIPSEYLLHIFKIFKTTSNTDNKGSTGTGIGLASVKSLIEGLGGEIAVTSEIGKGSNFEFTVKIE